MDNSSSNQGCLYLIKNFFFPKPSNFANKTHEDQPDQRITDELPYRLRDDFLSPAEHSFYMVIKQMMGNYLVICPKVSLADIFFVIQPNKNFGAINQINRKHIDFLICDPKTLIPRFAIELDDSTHKRSDREERDEFVDWVFDTAGLSLIHIPVRNAYDTTELGVLFKKALQGISFENRDDSTINQSDNSMNLTPGISESNNLAPFCPKCGVQMVLRSASSGSKAGQKFYGCKNFPRCRQIIPVKDY